jgi:hypothetical protein
MSLISGSYIIRDITVEGYQPTLYDQLNLPTNSALVNADLVLLQDLQGSFRPSGHIFTRR